MAREKRDSSKKEGKSKSSKERVHRVKEDGERVKMPDEVQEGMELLEEQRALNLENIKDSCKFELQRFISMRGKIDKETGKIHLPLMTVSDQNKTSIIKKIKEANDLSTSIVSANSVQEINEVLHKASSSLGDDLEAVIGKCMVIAEVSGLSNKPF